MQKMAKIKFATTISIGGVEVTFIDVTKPDPMRKNKLEAYWKADSNHYVIRNIVTHAEVWVYPTNVQWAAPMQKTTKTQDTMTEVETHEETATVTHASGHEEQASAQKPRRGRPPGVGKTREGEAANV